MILTAMATSIDSAAVGISLSLLQVNLLQACLIIGLVCTCVATSGVMLGHKVGPHLGKYANCWAASCCLPIGTQILVEHTLFQLVRHGLLCLPVSLETQKDGYAPRTAPRTDGI
jgi:putative Mn2+ efflux pump MntP